MSVLAHPRLQKWRDYYILNWRVPLYELDVKIGKRTFRDTTRFTEHIRGRYFLWRARMKSRAADPDGEGRRSWKIGFRKLGRVASDEQMTAIREKLDAAFNSGTAYRYVFHDRLAHISIQRANETVPELMTLLTPQVLDAVRAYYRTGFQLYNVGAWRNYHVPRIDEGEEPLSNNWHTDARRVDMLKVFVVATDVTEDDGPTHAITRQWTRKVIGMGFDHRRGYGIPVEKIEHPDHLVKLTGPAGTALLCNTNLCFHRAGLPGPGRVRDIIEFRFVASPDEVLTLPDFSKLSLRDQL